MIEQINLAGSFTLPGTSIAVNRMGYVAMQLAGARWKQVGMGGLPAMSRQRSLFCERPSRVA
jgi:hypothetical protein